MRLFIAINFKESVKNKIQDIIKEVKKYSIQGKFVNNEHMHLTLEFIGDIPSEKVETIKDVMDQVVTEPFTMTLSELGYFKRKEGNIQWLEIEHNEILLKTQAKLHQLLIKQGFELENRAYKPHLTIGRKVKLKDNFNSEDLSNIIKQISINVDKIDLMKSEHINGKLVHSIVYTKNI
ncbi:MAG: RNA 2',3'-cyclic phosphodiesterase [Tissierellia bacterium]|nr:RNA 2',3'-cyclic phosphodiesterase [Tissierellia bacterium]